MIATLYVLYSLSSYVLVCFKMAHNKTKRQKQQRQTQQKRSPSKCLITLKQKKRRQTTHKKRSIHHPTSPHRPVLFYDTL